jgi:hypothetical protein
MSAHDYCDSCGKMLYTFSKKYKSSGTSGSTFCESCREKHECFSEKGVVKYKKEVKRECISERGIIKYKRGRKQKDGSRVYIIRYKTLKGEEKEIRVKEKYDSDTSFHRGDKIEIKPSRYWKVSGRVRELTITNITLGISINVSRVPS